MVKITPMIRISNEASGFTALEILLATALIGIVSTVGLPQTDLFAELSDRGDAIAAAAEAQNRVNVKFTELLISGLACEKAADRVSDLALVSDGKWAGGEVFKGYAVSPRYLERFETYSLWSDWNPRQTAPYAVLKNWWRSKRRVAGTRGTKLRT